MLEGDPRKRETWDESIAEEIELLSANIDEEVKLLEQAEVYKLREVRRRLKLERACTLLDKASDILRGNPRS